MLTTSAYGLRSRAYTSSITKESPQVTYKIVLLVSISYNINSDYKLPERCFPLHRGLVEGQSGSTLSRELQLYVLMYAQADHSFELT